MMTVRVGINGFGRMGRLGVRAGFEAARPVTAAEVNGDFKAAAEGSLKGILG